MTNSKPWLWLLVASLALNVYFGVVVGTHFFRGPKGPPPGPGMMILDMAEALPEADARILRQTYEAHKAEFAQEPGPPHGFDRMRDVLAADPFGLQAFLRVESEFRANRERDGAVIGTILAEALPQMSADGRKRLANRPPPPRPR